MGLFKRKKKGYIYSPCDGEIVPLSEVNDEVFSSGALGEGFAVIPSSNNFYAPMEARVENAYETGHAYTLFSKNEIDLLVHIGIDTVELDGCYFTKKVAGGQSVTTNDILAEADINKIKEKGFDPITVVIVSNPEKIKNIDIKYGKCYHGDIAMEYDEVN
ncbi:MAG: PTS glucose transporter subunit IIA [Clostridia bacterium]|nr:PTS glucose transporter subunit IIA [Clostridia bacterium]MBP3495710.1 PTS glucose transporter subunit IIA [Clostridia bacterium]MBQ7789369.1 PTS glucose transporter subunit IIA [Clostridia bacterium]